MRCIILMMINALCSITIYAQKDIKGEIENVLRDHVLREGKWALQQEPVTVTAFICPRSHGGIHDFYSEGDYWWPNPADPEGPYVQRDGQTNPDNFVEHRKAMVRLSRIIGALASAYLLTADTRYVRHAFNHFNSWFIDSATMMNPSLLYAQAIHGRATGRGIGIIDTIHLLEVAQGLRVMENAPGANPRQIIRIKQWFSAYLQWMTTHRYGIDERNATNNHGTCWVMQVAAFARLVGNDSLVNFCKERYKNVLISNQMAEDGSFPQELRRTKPYGYSLFNLDAMATVCHILSDEQESLWLYEAGKGRSIFKGITFLFPYVKEKSRWPYAKDVMYWDEWPVAHPFLVFGAVAFRNKTWLSVWKELNHAPNVEEVLRNLPVRNPLIWLN